MFVLVSCVTALESSQKDSNYSKGKIKPNSSILRSIGFKKSKWLYLSNFASNKENVGTLFSLTLKVEENQFIKI